MSRHYEEEEYEEESIDELTPRLQRYINFNNKRFYEIPNNQGYFISIDGHVYSQRLQRELRSNNLSNAGYFQVTINGRNQLVHRLMYETFIGEIPRNMTINHINCIRTDNRLENLELVSHRENCNKRLNHEVVNELPRDAIKIKHLEYHKPNQVYNIHKLYYYDNHIYEKFDTCYRRINSNRQGQCRVNGKQVSLLKLTR